MQCYKNCIFCGPQPFMLCDRREVPSVKCKMLNTQREGGGVSGCQPENTRHWLACKRVY